MNYHSPSYSEYVQDLERRARELHPPAPGLLHVAVIAIGIGVLGFLIGVFYAPGRTWGAFDANFVFWVGFSQGAIIVAAVFNTGWARWGRTVQRLIEALGGFVFAAPILYLILWAGRTYLFSWTHLSNRSPWQNAVFMLWRDELVLLTMAGLSGWWLYRSLRPDVGLMLHGRPSGDRFTTWLTRNWRSQQAETDLSQAVLRNLGPWIIVGFCWGSAMVAIDLAMTVDPLFKSTMWPGIYWVSEFLAPAAFGTVLVWAWRRWDGAARDLITRSNIQDLGNLAWGFAIFRTWFAWSQYIIIWYGNLPDEAKYLMDRWRTHPWNVLAYLSLGCVFIGPFFAGFSRTIKRNPGSCACLGGAIFLGVLGDRFLDVMPSIHPLGPNDLGLIELAITVGFAGAVALPYLWLLERVPLFPIADPIFTEALETRGAPET